MNTGQFWTAAGSEAPRRFGMTEKLSIIVHTTASKNGVAASLCHRTP
jgi:hypothetical protein